MSRCIKLTKIMPRIQLLILIFNLALSEPIYKYCKPETNELKCYNGACKQLQNNSDSELSCECEKGWIGPECKSCGGRVSLDAAQGGVIMDGYSNYTVDTKCSWLIQGRRDIPIRLKFEEFATECSWDHMYVYDGDSIYSPLVAVFSGLLLTENVGHNTTIPEITLLSGSAFLHFYSDAAYNMSGFSISYKMGSCPLDCSGRGECNLEDRTCLCASGWMGDACDIPKCPNNCNSQPCHLRPQVATHKICDCDKTQFVGIDCSIPSFKGYWEEIEYTSAPQDVPSGRASHKTVLIGEEIWMIGGYDFNVDTNPNVARYDITRKRWRRVEPVSRDLPRPRYGHSLATYDGNIFMYGGIMGNTVTDELWMFNITSSEWVYFDFKMIHSVHSHSDWRAVVGHTAHVIDGIMYIIFGHSPIYGYMNAVQECNMSSFVFKQAPTGGAVVKGGYGHASAYDAASGRILVHGGYHSGSHNEYHLSSTLYAYHPKHREWTILKGSGNSFHPPYLHSAVITDGLMLVFAGNTHNDSSESKGAKCYSSNFIAYDIDCDRWYDLDPPLLNKDSSRFGHSAEVIVNQNVRDNSVTYEMYIFGGFSGVMLNDMLLYMPGNCKRHESERACLASREGVKCVWVDDQTCVQRSDAVIRKRNKMISSYHPGENECADPNSGVTAFDRNECPLLKECPSCLSTSYSCEWCSDRSCAAAGTCQDSDDKIIAYSEIDVCYWANYTDYSDKCHTLHNCHACNTDAACRWQQSDTKCQKRTAQQKDAVTPPCGQPSCYTHTACENCTSSGCMWCSNQQRCVESNVYVASFPYGQCMEWTTSPQKCPATRCSELRTCSDCQENPACGWCDDGKNMGIGQCMQGGFEAPVMANGTVSPRQCPAERWYFADCPLCQCNGHSECNPDTNECTECRDLTTGPQCAQCADGYYGNPKNGRNCTACECSERADTCNHENGSCFCHTKGVTGDTCNECEENHKYYSGENGGSCFYQLKTDYQYTFNLSKADDKYYRFINFMAVPEDAERDVDFNINCSDNAYMNLTVRTKHGEKVLLENVDCYLFNTDFSHKTFQFGKKANTTFYVYVYNFETPFLLVISFSQFPQIDLLQFFVTFFSCFLSLLAIAAVLWKVKQRYDRYQAIQRMKVEREQWANRPFAATHITMGGSDQSLMEHKKHPPEIYKPPKAKNKEKSQPSYIAMEPMAGGKAAVVSVVFRMPCGDEEHTPPGISGVTIGTSLILFGNSHKVLLETAKQEKVTQSKGIKSSNNNGCPENMV